MLAAANRLGDASSFREVTRRGRRAASRSLVVHVLEGGLVDAPEMVGGAGEPVFGLVVSRAVGNSVVRNRVKRRLRHLLRARISPLPPRSRIVVRALPAAAGSTSAGLGRDLDQCLGRIFPEWDGQPR